MSNAVKYDIQEGDWHFLFKTIKRHLPVNLRRDIRCDIAFLFSSLLPRDEVTDRTQNQ